MSDTHITALCASTAAICKASGFHTVRPTPLSLLAQQLRYRIEEIGRGAKNLSEHARRTDPTIQDVLLVLRKLRTDPETLASLRPNTFSTQTLKPNPQLQIPRPLSVGTKQSQPPSVPPHIPPFPDPHTYRSTSVRSQEPPCYEDQRNKMAEQHRLGAESLVRYAARTGRVCSVLEEERGGRDLFFLSAAPPSQPPYLLALLSKKYLGTNGASGSKGEGEGGSDTNPFLKPPNEVLELILRSDEMDHSSLCQLSLVCRRLKLLVSESKLWNLKAKRRWRVWRSGERRFRLASYDQLEIPGVTDWKKLYIERHECEKKIGDLLEELSEAYVLLDKNNGLVDDINLLSLRNMLDGHDFVMETLREIVDGTTNQLNLSHQFYAPSAYSFIKRVQMMESFTSVFESSMNSSVELMSQIAIWIDQWMHPLEDLENFDYSGEFDRLADLAKQGLSEGASQWEIVSRVDRVMFQEEGYRVNINFYMNANSYLHNVIRTKKGIYISLSVIFQAVASRLGLRLLPVSFPGYFVLSYEETGSVAGGSRKQFLTFVEGNRVRKMSDLELQPAMSLFNEEVLTKLSSMKIVTSRMLANIFITLMNGLPSSRIEENVHFIKCLELYELFADIFDGRIKKAYNLAKVNLNYNLEQQRYPDISERFQQLLKERNYLTEKKEMKDLRRRYINCEESVISQAYPIGLIVRLYFGATICFGVIFEWSTEPAPENSPHPSSTVYSLLVDGDRFLRCPSSELIPCLSLNEARTVSHYLVGKYFSRFNGCYYQPIPLLQQLYSNNEVRIKSLISN